MTRYFMLAIILPAFVQVTASWDCSQSKHPFCFQWLDTPQTWDRAQMSCSNLMAQIPGDKHARFLADVLQSSSEKKLWLSLCHHAGKFQWLAPKAHEERNISFIDSLIPSLPLDVDDNRYCYYLNEDFRLTAAQRNQLLPSICVIDRNVAKVNRKESTIEIEATSAVTQGEDIDWGPIGKNRHGFMSVLGPRYRSIQFKCNPIAKVQLDDQRLDYQWIRNDGYMDTNSQIISFASEDDLIDWIGSITCQITSNGRQVNGDGFHFVLWNIVTLKIVSRCPRCLSQDIIDMAQRSLREIMENEFSNDLSALTEFFVEPPIITDNNITLTLHLRNKNISNFDFKMASLLGDTFRLKHLSGESISPCNMNSDQDPADDSISWIGYRGQTVPSGNIIGGPICVDAEGSIITRSCTNSKLDQQAVQQCSSARPRREDPQCFIGHHLVQGAGCYLITEPTNYISATSQCWSGWQIQKPTAWRNVAEWINQSTQWMNATSNHTIQRFWMPIRRPLINSRFQYPVWKWDAASDGRWLKNDEALSAEEHLNNIQRDGALDHQFQCAAYDTILERMIQQPCQSNLPMICHREQMSDVSLSQLVSSQADHVGQFHCPDGWVSHILVATHNICFRRFDSNRTLDWDEAERHCRRNGGHLAIAPTNHLRIALEQVYQYLNNQSVIDSWIGLKAKAGHSGQFIWANGDQRMESYNWQPYNEFGDGYGVSTGISRMWWNWPQDVKLSGWICQKNVTDWTRYLALRLESANRSNLTIRLTYDPPMIKVRENSQIRWQKNTRPSWIKRIQVLCHLAEHSAHYEFNSDLEPINLQIPRNMQSGEIQCEAWCNQPTLRVVSNVLTYQSARSHTFIIEEMLDKEDAQIQDTIDAFVQRLSQIDAQSFFTNLSVHASGIDSQSSTIRYHLSLRLISSDLKNLQQAINNCHPANVIRHSIGKMDEESLIYFFLKSCLPSAYNFTQQLTSVRSTRACQIESTGNGDLSKDPMVWIKTDIGSFARPDQLCLSRRQYLLHRLCLGDYHQGAYWSPLKFLDGSAFSQCEPPESVNPTIKNLFDLEQRSNNNQGNSAMDVLLRTYAELDAIKSRLTVTHVEITLSILNNILAAVEKAPSGKSGADHLDQLVTIILQKIFDLDSLAESDYLEHLLQDLVSVFSRLASGTKSSKRWDISQHLLIMAHRIRFNSSPTAANDITFSTSAANVTVPLNRQNLRNRTQIMATFSVISAQLFAVNGKTKQIDRLATYSRHASDPTNIEPLGLFSLASSIVSVDLSTEPPLTYLSWPLIIQLGPLQGDSEVMHDVHVCARWDPHAINATGAWFSDDCLYLGKENDSHVCQCRSSGVFVLLVHSARQVYVDKVIITMTLLFFSGVSLWIVLHFYCKVGRTTTPGKISFEYCFVDNRIHLQLVISWNCFLVFYLGQSFHSTSDATCIALSTICQYFLLVSLVWVTIASFNHRHKTRGTKTTGRTIYLLEISFAAWSIPTFVFVTVPMYKWKFVEVDSQQCWMESSADFWLTLSLVITFTLIHICLLAKEMFKKGASISLSIKLRNHQFNLANVILLSSAAVLAVASNTNLYTLTSLCIVSSCLAGTLLATFQQFLKKSLINQTNSDNQIPRRQHELAQTTPSNATSHEFINDQ